MRTVALHTVGCKLNFAETSFIGSQFLERGFRLVEFGAPADVCVINTCTVTEKANRECRQLIGRARRTSGDPFIIVTGCYAQLEPEEVASIDGVDLVLGAREKFSLFKYAGNLRKNVRAQVVVSDINTADDFGPGYSAISGQRTRAFLKVQDGCDYQCSFCTIPLARGASRSQPIEECVRQARRLVDAGYKEIVLTGVNLGDYGKKTGSSLLELLRALVETEGLKRLRMSSVEPNLLKQEIIDFVAESTVVCKHFHIPLQSGHDRVLRAMRRRYTVRQYAELIHHINEALPGCGIGVDVITGFPGETDDEFEETYRFLNDLQVSYLHVFTYSERPDTPAARFSGSVEPAVRNRRNEMLRILGQKKKQAFCAGMVGKTLEVLLEEDVDDGLRFGFTENYVRVGVASDSTSGNEIRSVEIVGVDAGKCIGKTIDHRTEV